MTVTGVPVQESVDSPEGPIGRPRRDTRTALLMVAPALIGLILFVLVPFLTAIWLSFRSGTFGSAIGPKWVGFQQYHRILFESLFSQDFYDSLRNNAIFAVVVVPLQTALALALAMLLNRPLKGMAFFRTFFFMPVVFPMALVAVIWNLIYTRGSLGLGNAFLSAISGGHIKPIDWLGDSHYALIAIIILSIWQGVGFQMVIILAGLQGISSSLYEAASIDTAGRWKQFVNITLPGLRNTLIFVVMVTSIFSFRLFDQVNILTPQGGPDNSTTTLMFQAVNASNIGRGAAYTVVFVLIVVLLTVVQRLVLREEREIS